MRTCTWFQLYGSHEGSSSCRPLDVASLNDDDVDYNNDNGDYDDDNAADGDDDDDDDDNDNDDTDDDARPPTSAAV